VKKILILDPSCVSDSRSHHMNAILGHARAFLAAGFKVSLGTNIKCSIKSNDFDNYPVFTYTIYDDYKNKVGKYSLFKTIPHCYLQIKTKKIVANLLNTDGIREHQEIFVPSTDWILFQSLMKIYSKAENKPNIHFLIMYEQGSWMTGGYPYNKIIGALKKNANDLQKNIFIYTETNKHAQNISRELGFIPPNYSYPSFPVSDVSIDSGRHIYIGALGGGRKDKGYDMLPDIISKFNDLFDDNENVRFLIQRARDEDNLGKATQILERIKNVILLDNQLTQHQYYNNLLRCSIAIFPYNSNVYDTRGSGIINEAIANGIPIICNSETALSEAIICDNGISVANVEHYSEAIVNVINNLSTYSNNALAAKEEYLEHIYNNPVIKNINTDNR